jgi:hypothetical protein
MHPCDFEDMDCPQETNFAAIAKQLHETAVQAEERIFCMEQQLRSAVNRPTFVATTTADMGPFSSSVGTDPQTGSTIFRTTDPITVNFSNMISPNSTVGWALDPGIWHVGAYGASFSVGAASDNTYRQLRILKVRTHPIVGTAEFLEEASHTSYESANGVQILLSVDGVFKMEAGERILFLFRHGNTASNVSIDDGAIVWMTRLSDSDVVRVI